MTGICRNIYTSLSLLWRHYLCCHQKGGTVSHSLGEEQSKVSFVMKMAKGVCHCSSHDGVYTGEGSVEEDHD